MKLLVGCFSILFFIQTVFADEQCSAMSKSDDKKFQNSRIKSYQCQISWKEGKITQSAEIVYLTSYCNQFEGGNAIDCLMARTCTSKGEKFSDYGPSLFLEKAVVDQMCEENRYFLFGVEGSKGLQAWVNCHNKKPKDITIKSPTGKSVKCAFPTVVH